MVEALAVALAVEERAPAVQVESKALDSCHAVEAAPLLAATALWMQPQLTPTLARKYHGPTDLQSAPSILILQLLVA